MRADVISGRYPILHHLALNLTFEMTLNVEMKVIVVLSVPNLTLERGLVEILIHR